MKRLLLVIAALLILLVSGLSCADSDSPTPAPIKDSTSISWDEAKNHVGDRATVYGTVVDAKWASGSKGKPTFLNIGKPYPDPNRFTVVIWIENRGKFHKAPEIYYLGKTIYVTGLIVPYKGIAEIEVKDPSQIQER